MDLTFCFLHYKSRPICEIKCLFRCSASNGIAHLWPILSQFNCKCNVSQTHLCTMSNKLFWSQQKQGADFWANLSKTDFVLLKLFEVRRDITVLGPKRLECFDSTAWNWYYSMVSHQNDHNDYKGKMVPHQRRYWSRWRIVERRMVAKGIILKVMVEEYP